MLDPKAVAEAMDAIIERVRKVAPADRATAANLGYVVGVARAVRMQCEQAGKPAMRGASGKERP